MKINQKNMKMAEIKFFVEDDDIDVFNSEMTEALERTGLSNFLVRSWKEVKMTDADKKWYEKNGRPE